MVASRWFGAAMIVVGACSTDATSDYSDGGEGEGSGTSGTVTGPQADPTTADSSVGDEQSEGPPGHACPETHECIAPAPESWLGPVALLSGGADACPQGYPQLEVDAFTQVGAAPARCSCECDTSPLCGALLGSDLETACSFPSPIFDTTLFAEPDVCTPIPTIEGAGFHLAFEPQLDAQCAPAASVIVPEPAPGDRVLVCGGPLVAGDCLADQLCVPLHADPQTTAPCILRTGDHECPFDFPATHRAFTSVLDARGCSPCECTAPDGPASCDATVRLSSVDDCTDEVVPDAEVGAFTCVPTDGVTITHLQFSAIDTLVTGCEPSGGLPIGTVEPAAPVTICCAG